jgi:hypothetical protein
MCRRRCFALSAKKSKPRGQCGFVNYAGAVRWRAGAATGLSVLVVTGIGSAAPVIGSWRPVARVIGIVDVVGPRADGRLVLASRGGLFLFRRGSAPVPIARGPQGYTGSAGEPYIALGTGHAVPGARCSFRRSDIFVLNPGATPGVLRVDRNGRSRQFASLPAGAFPSGIAIDRVGSFGYRLLVTATASGKTALHAFDCRGRDRLIAAGAPSVEGGLAVAPRTFGRFGGSLIAADEGSGRLYAFGPGGRTRLVVESGVPAGGDVGVEAVGFVPSSFGHHGTAYLSDLGSPGSPTSGSDSLLSLPAAAVARAHLHAGELVVATEAGAKTLAVRCRRVCTIRHVADGPATAHAEGHITFVSKR